MARRRAAGREIPRRTGGDEAPQAGTRPEIYAVLARGLDPETQGTRNQLLGTVLPLDPHGPQHGPPAPEKPADDLGDAQDHQPAGAPDQRRAEQAQACRGRGVPRHVPLRAGILHPAGTARPHAARQGPRRAHHRRQGHRSFPRQRTLRTAALRQAVPRNRGALYRQRGDQLFRAVAPAQHTQHTEHRGRRRQEHDFGTGGRLSARSRHESPRDLMEQGLRRRAEILPARRKTRRFRAGQTG